MVFDMEGQAKIDAKNYRRISPVLAWPLNQETDSSQTGRGERSQKPDYREICSRVFFFKDLGSNVVGATFLGRCYGNTIVGHCLVDGTMKPSTQNMLQNNSSVPDPITKARRSNLTGFSFFNHSISSWTRGAKP